MAKSFVKWTNCSGGTHTGKNQLLPRLNQHFLKANKNRSIFRKNIGRCILNKEKSDYLSVWEIDTTSRAERERVSAIIDFDFERELEKRISTYIQTKLSFCIFKIDAKEERLRWESKIVSTLSRSTEPNSSPTWLGRHSTKQKIRESGLWQVNELYKEEITESELEELEGLISIVPNYNSIYRYPKPASQ